MAIAVIYVEVLSIQQIYAQSFFLVVTYVQVSCIKCLCPFHEPENWMSPLASCCVCLSSMHSTCLCPYYELKVHDDQDNGVVVAINVELG